MDGIFEQAITTENQGEQNLVVALPELTPQEAEFAALKMPWTDASFRQKYEAMNFNQMNAAEKSAVMQQSWDTMQQTAQLIGAKLTSGSSSSFWAIAEYMENNSHDYTDDIAELAEQAPHVIKQIAMYAEYSYVLVHLLDQTGILDAVITHDSLKADLGFQNERFENSASSMIGVLTAQLKEFSDTINQITQINSPDDGYGYAISNLYHLCEDAFENFFEQNFNRAKPVERRSQPVPLKGFEQYPSTQTLLQRYIDECVSPQAVAHIDEIRLETTQPPETIDNDGNHWLVAGRYNVKSGDVKLFPVTLQDLSLMIQVFTHEAEGHGDDELCFNMNYFKRHCTVPPWVMIPFMHALENLDPKTHPATEYVKRVTGDEIAANVIVTPDSANYPSSWSEQFAELMAIFRLNPQQFVIDHGESAYKAFAMYCIAIDNCTYEEFKQRQQTTRQFMASLTQGGKHA